MKKSILILLASILLTGCSVDEKQDELYLINDKATYENYRGTYVNKDMKKLFDDLNTISVEDGISEKFYVHRSIVDDEVVLNPEASIYLSEESINPKSFLKIVDELDKTIGRGVGAYVREISPNITDIGSDNGSDITEKTGKMDIKGNDDTARKLQEVETKKFGKVLVGRDNDGYTFLNIEAIDIRDGKVKEIYDDMTGGKYLLSKVLNMGDKKYIEFESPSLMGSGELIIIYGVVLDGYDVEKVNIFTNSYNKKKSEDIDIEELNSVLSYLKLEDTKSITKYFDNLGSNKTGKERFKSGNYKVDLITINGDYYSSPNGDYQRGYISIEKN